jgi:hypothetical protein
MPEPMVIYDGRVAIGEIVDVGPGKVKAYAVTESGRVPLGRRATRILRHHGGASAKHTTSARSSGGRWRCSRAIRTASSKSCSCSLTGSIAT